MQHGINSATPNIGLINSISHLDHVKSPMTSDRLFQQDLLVTEPRVQSQQAETLNQHDQKVSSPRAVVRHVLSYSKVWLSKLIWMCVDV